MVGCFNQQTHTRPCNQILVSKKHMSIFSLDFAKAFEKIGIHSLIHHLEEWQLGPRIVKYIWNFMANRKLIARNGTSFAYSFPLKNGVPPRFPYISYPLPNCLQPTTIYGKASPSQNFAIRAALGAFRTTPTNNLLVESKINTIEGRQELLTGKLATKTN